MTTTRKQNFWKGVVDNENKLRLAWFQKNEDRLNDIVNEETEHEVPKYKQLITQARLKLHNQQIEKKVKPGKPEHADFAHFTPEIIPDMMRPVDPEIKQLLYAGEKEGRKKYLHERVKILPENRYYFPETTNFEYGWKMFKCSPQYVGFGRQRIIKNSFYRRNGVDRDPEWYRDATTSITTCGSI